MTLRSVLVCVLGLAVSACAERQDPPKETIDELPSLSRYVDVKAATPRGAKGAVLEIGEIAQGQFDRDRGFAAYELVAPAGLVELRLISSDGIGTSPIVDTLLIVFGPQRADGSYPARALTLNDDLAETDTNSHVELWVPEVARYLLVATTYDNHLAYPENISDGGYQLTSQ